MRILVEGDNSSAQAVRTGVGKAGIRLSDVSGMYGMYFRVIIEKSLGDDIIIDSIAGELEAELINCIARLTPTPIRLHRAGGIQNERDAKIIVPLHDKHRQAIELGIVRAIVRLTQAKAPYVPEKESSVNNPVPDEFAKELDEFHAQMSTLEIQVGESLKRLNGSIDTVRQRMENSDLRVAEVLSKLENKVNGLANSFGGALGTIENQIDALPKPPTLQEIESHIESRKWYRRVLAYLGMMLLCLPLHGQQLANTVTRVFAGAPTNPCTTFQLAKNTVNKHFYSCDPGTLTWVDIGPGSGSGSQHQLNGVNLTSNDPINFVDSASVTWANPSAGNIVATAVGGGFPRLDQVLDPNVDKTFDLTTHNLVFNNGTYMAFYPTLTSPPGTDIFTIGPILNYDIQSNLAGLFVDVSVKPTAANSSVVYGSEVRLQTDPTATKAIGGLIGYWANVSENNDLGASFPIGILANISSAATNDTITGGDFEPFNSGSPTGQTISGIFVRTTNNADATQALGVWIGSHTKNGGGATTTNYGMKIDDQAAGATNYAIKTGLGQNSFGDKTTGTRFSIGNATALVSGDFALSAGWGNTASIGSIRGTDQAWSATVTSTGTGQADSPTVDLTFKNGTWTTIPVFVCKQSNGTGIVTDVTYTVSATHLILTWLATPTATATYEFSCIGFGT